MFLPTVSLDPLSGLDRSLNAVKLLKVGTGGFETPLDADGNPIDVRTARASAYVFDLDGNLSDRDYTVEYLGRPLTGSDYNVIWSSTDALTVINQLVLTVTSRSVTLLRTFPNPTPDLGILNEYEIPPEERVGEYSVVMTKLGTVYRVYFNGRLVFTRNWVVAQIGTRGVLNGVVANATAQTLRYGYNGTLTRLQYHDKIVLPQEMWASNDPTLPRDVRLSMVPNTVLEEARDLGKRTLVDISIVGIDLVATFNDGARFLVKRPRGLDTGVIITAARLSGVDILVSLSDGRELNLGNAVDTSGSNDWPSTVGDYLVNVNGEKTFINLEAAGDTILQRTSGGVVLSLPSTAANPIDYNKFISIEATVLKTQWGFNTTTRGVGSWNEFVTQTTGRGLAFTVSTQGRTVVPAGKYLVKGSVLVARLTNAIARLQDVANDLTLALSQPSFSLTDATTVANRSRPTELIFSTLIDIFVDTEIAIQVAGTASDASNIAADANVPAFGLSTGHVLKFYKLD